jgi:hypothetical protein
MALPGHLPVLSSAIVMTRLWHLTRAALALLLVGTGAVAVWLAAGGADPPRTGALMWRDPLLEQGSWRIQSGNARWTPDGVTLRPDSNAPAMLLTAAPDSDFTFEVLAQPTSADSLYGLVIDWSPSHHSPVLVNGNGFAHVFTLVDDDARDIFGLAQWPWIRPGVAANRVRVDVRASQVEVRINQEWLVTFDRGPAAPELGLWAEGRVTFREAGLWTSEEGR